MGGALSAVTLSPLALKVRNKRYVKENTGTLCRYFLSEIEVADENFYWLSPWRCLLSGRGKHY
ncbi:hypothetical protein DMH17_01885 [Raoultella planticola]|nr:hypothetical protein [Raoultella planticola]